LSAHVDLRAGVCSDRTLLGFGSTNPSSFSGPIIFKIVVRRFALLDHGAAGDRSSVDPHGGDPRVPGSELSETQSSSTGN